jgi:lysophospholipid acyltransferase (LPLAT)-like uncharacterized protein
MKWKHPILQRALGLVAGLLVRVWSRTVDWKAIYFEPTVDPVHPRHHGRYVFAVWHEYMLLPIALRGNRHLRALASSHADGEVVSRAMRHLGWGMARGSSTRGGTAALLRMLRDDDRHLALTPDGPRGPRRQMSLGPIFLGSKLALPLVCLGVAYHRPWRTGSWDRFGIPRPFSRARAVFGPPLPVPANLDREALEAYRAWFEQLLNWLTEEAEAWAESGTIRPGEMAMLPAKACAAMVGNAPVPSQALSDRLAKSYAELPGSIGFW